MKILFIAVLMIFQLVVKAQPSTSFSFPATPYSVCKGEEIELKNSSVNASSYLWDFCPETFTEIPIGNSAIAITGLTNGWGYKVVKSGNEWFGFLASRNTNKLFRLEFGTNPNSNPQIFDLGNPGGLLISPQGMDVVQDNGNWYCFLGKGETTTGQIVRIDFGNNLRNTPVAVGLGTFGVTGRLRDVKVVKQGLDLILLIVVDSGNALRRINYRDSFNNSISAGDITSTGVLSGANLPLGFSVTRVAGDWIVHTVSFSNNGIQQYNFGNNILGPPTFIANYSFPTVSKPYYIKILREGNKYFGFVGNESLTMSIINFGDLTGATSPVEMSNTNFQRMVNFDIIKYQSKDIIQGVITGSANFSQLSFENISCNVSRSWSDTLEPIDINWSAAGTYNVELSAYSADNLSDATSNVVTVNNFQAPNVTVISDNVCVLTPVSFSTSSTKQINSWSWNFGDNTTSTSSNPVHQYSSVGIYNVNSVVTDLNGCKVTATKPLRIFDKPQADFILPVSPLLCSYQEYFFQNTSTFDSQSGISWEWSINSENVSTTKDLSYLFSNILTQEVKLTASIPGCSSESVKEISTLIEGPQVEFSTTGQCQNQSITFTNNSTGSINSYNWAFGDGGTSNLTSPDHIYETPDIYSITLQANSPNGCQNTKTKAINIYSKPQPNFSLALPPFSCSGSASKFTDTTPNPSDSNLSSWQWSFGDPSSSTSSQRNPQFIYDDAGNYDVSLTATTNFGCSDTFQKSVTIAATPNIGIVNTPSCVNQPVTFMGETISNISSWDWQIGNTYYSVAEPTYLFTGQGNYSVSLNAAGSNGCLTSSQKSVYVPAALIPDFSWSKNCAMQQTEFQSNTAEQDDPITAFDWNYAGLGTGVGPLSTFSFPALGVYDVDLKITTEIGCQYTKTKTAQIFDAPIANFSATPSTGSPPLKVQFTNQSINANTYLWNFNDRDNSTSVVASPQFTFDEIGSYVVDLTAFNSQGCSAIVSKIIEVQTPSNDVALTMFQIDETATGDYRGTLVIHNKGNVSISNLLVIVEINGIRLQERIAGPVLPGLYTNYELSFNVLKQANTNFVCAKLELPGDNSPADNEACVALNSETFYYEPSPNPAHDNVTVQWISSGEEECVITVVDAMGKEKYRQKLVSTAGLNKETIETDKIDSGVYFILFTAGQFKKASKIVIVH